MALNDLVKKLIYGDDTDKDYDENDSADYQDEYDASEAETVQNPSARTSSASAAGYGVPQGNNVNMTSGSAIEMKVIKPDSLNSVTQIADCLLDRKTVLLNLEDASKETAHRLIDFLQGVTYAINGALNQVAASTYVVTPNNVEVTGDQIQKARENNDLV